MNEDPSSAMKSLLLTDINVLGIGSMREYEFQHRTHRGRPTAAIHGTLAKLMRLIRQHPDSVPVILWDDRCRWREALLPQYKRHRWETPEQQAFLQSYLAQAEVIQALLACLGFVQLRCADFEADDIAGHICRRLAPEWQITLATSDSDWYQALADNVRWFSPRTGKIVTAPDLQNVDIVEDGPFLSTDHYIQAKALAGDTSDGIPGVRGVGLKTAARIIREQGSVEALWARFDAGQPLKGAILQRAAGPEYRQAYRRNLRLIDWRLAPPLDAGLNIDFKAADTMAFAELCADWGLEDKHAAWADIHPGHSSTQAAVQAIQPNTNDATI